jgi:hypothetical protein
MRLAADMLTRPVPPGGWPSPAQVAAALNEHASDTTRLANLVIRQAMALDYEGIGPDGDEDTDGDTLAAAVHLAGGDFDQHELWNNSLIEDDDHPAGGCGRCQMRGRTDA